MSTEQRPEPGAAGTPGAVGLRFLLAHPAHLVALGFGSGLAPRAPGTAGTLWAWLVFAALERVLTLTRGELGLLTALSLPLGWWACTRAAQHLAIADPGAIVWDEVVAFWFVLWALMPASWAMQLAAFVLFRIFDAAKPGPVAWADRRFKPGPNDRIGWAQGAGILLDDVVAALCTLALLVPASWLWGWR